eukprot:758429-Hanusia_phi.AAC.1
MLRSRLLVTIVFLLGCYLASGTSPTLCCQTVPNSRRAKALSCLQSCHRSMRVVSLRGGAQADKAQEAQEVESFSTVELYSWSSHTSCGIRRRRMRDSATSSRQLAACVLLSGYDSGLTGRAGDETSRRESGCEKQGIRGVHGKTEEVKPFLRFSWGIDLSIRGEQKAEYEEVRDTLRWGNDGTAPPLLSEYELACQMTRERRMESKLHLSLIHISEPTRPY